MLLPDLLSAVLRGLSFVTMAQAAGGVLFLALFGPVLTQARPSVARIARTAITAGLIVLPAQFALEAGRMAGSIRGVVDFELQTFALSTTPATVLWLRMGALVVLAGATRSQRFLWAGAAVGVALMVMSFVLTGHSAASDVRWLLAPLIGLHVLIVLFWFGALWPLHQVARREPPAIAAQVVHHFSRLAVALVPVIFVAGAMVAAVLLPGWRALGSTYGMGILAKAAAFACLMALAALNKWRFGPALREGGPAAQRRFSRAVEMEWILLVAVLAGTAVLTQLVSPP